MKLSLNYKTNRSALAFVAGALGRCSLPVLENMRLTTDGGGGALAVTTDLDVTLVAALEGKVEETKPCLLPGKKLIELIKTGSNITINSNCKTAEVTVDGNTFKVLQMDEKEFPTITKVDSPFLTIEARADHLLRAIACVKAAQSTDETRYILNGINLEAGAKQKNSTTRTLRLVATDGRRLHTYDVPFCDIQGTAHRPNVEHYNVIIPSKAVAHLVRLLKCEPVGGPVLIEVQDGSKDKNGNGFDVVRVQGSGLMLTTKEVAGSYPNWRQVIPSASKVIVPVDVPAWLGALAAVEPFVSEKNNSVKLEFTESIVRFTTNTPGVGEGKAEVLIAASFKKPMGIAFNPEYLREALLPFKDSDKKINPVGFGMVDELSPCHITANNYQAVIMPMRLS